MEVRDKRKVPRFRWLRCGWFVVGDVGDGGDEEYDDLHASAADGIQQSTERWVMVCVLHCLLQYPMVFDHGLCGRNGQEFSWNFETRLRLRRVFHRKAVKSVIGYRLRMWKSVYAHRIYIYIQKIKTISQTSLQLLRTNKISKNYAENVLSFSVSGVGFTKSYIIIDSPLNSR